MESCIFEIVSKTRDNNFTIHIHVHIFISLNNIDQELATSIKNSNFSEHNVLINYVKKNLPPPKKKYNICIEREKERERNEGKTRKGGVRQEKEG